MAIVRTDDKHYKAIADAIRNQPGYTDNYTPEQMPSAIISAMSDANAAGMGAGYDDGYALGKEAKYNEFWDAYQDDGNRNQYSYAFAQSGWNDATFKPKFDIKPTELEYGFMRCQCTQKMQDIETECNMTFDFSNCTKFNYAFFYSEFTELPDIDLSKAEATLNRVFAGCKAAKIGTVTISENQNFNALFQSCSSLREIRFAGGIGGTGLDLTYTRLEHDSLLSLIDTLVNVGASRTVALGSYNRNQLSDEEKAIATEKGWTLA